MPFKASFMVNEGPVVPPHGHAKDPLGLDFRDDEARRRGITSIAYNPWAATSTPEKSVAMVELEASSADAIRWFARERCRVTEDSPAFEEIERQLARGSID